MSRNARRTNWGRMPDGTIVEAITLTCNAGISATILSYGAAIQSVLVPDRDEHLADVALGYSDLEGYMAGTEYFGCIVGRVANRIAGGRFTLDGRDYQVPVNNGPNALHGGPRGFDKVNWEVAHVGDAAVMLQHRSLDGDQGFPGTLTVTATYSLNDKGRLTIEYGATTDRPTIVNLSNHAYWNLAGEGSPSGAMEHLLTIPAEAFHPTDPTSIPTGEVRPVAGTPFDFGSPIPVGARIRDGRDEQIGLARGYDHNWRVAETVAREPHLLAHLMEPVSGRVLEVHSTQPGLQFYSGNFLDGSVRGKSGKLYRQGDAIVLEPQMPPDTPNRPEFGSIRLDAGQTYRNLIEFRFGLA